MPEMDTTPQNNMQLVPAGGTQLQIGGFNPFTTSGFYIPPQMDVSADALLTMCEKYAAFVGNDRLYIGDMLNTIKQRHPDVYGKAEALFPQYTGKVGQLRNIVYVTNAVPPQRRPLGVTFGHIRAVASLTAEVQDKLLNETVTNVDPITNERKTLTVEQLEERVKSEKAVAGATAGDGATAVPTVALQPPFSDLRIVIPGCEEGAKVTEWVKTATAMAQEYIKRHSNADYRNRQEAKERDKAVKELLKDVPEADRSQFDKLVNSAAPVKEVAEAVRKYTALAAATAELEKQLGLLPPSQQTAFEEMRAKGAPVSEILTAVKAAATKHTQHAELTELFKDSKVTADEQKPYFERLAKMAESNEKFSDIKKAAKDAVKKAGTAADRQAKVDELLKDIPDGEDKDSFVKMAAEGKSIPDISKAVRDWRTAKKQADAKVSKENLEKLKTMRTRAANWTKTITTLREAGDPASSETAGRMEVNLEKLNDEIIAFEKEIGVTAADPANTKGPILKPSQGGPGGKGKGKGTTKGTAKRGRK